ncbi:CLUMA_CG006365, isoform A [Clunio marinus]|uniref:CLUMA_CG006365, isoform A n=1 Tax=Clunio marinus TaxID=568069 RepID=A0A1J1HXE9_9DIPT|nr:CLUMA_CG006365, isoform A [Clunio marinus]
MQQELKLKRMILGDIAIDLNFSAIFCFKLKKILASGKSDNSTKVNLKVTLLETSHFKFSVRCLCGRILGPTCKTSRNLLKANYRHTKGAVVILRFPSNNEKFEKEICTSPSRIQE